MWNKERFQRAQLALRSIKEDFSLNQCVRTVAAFDVSFQAGLGVGVVALFNYQSVQLMECEIVVKEPYVPYVPTYLAFREMPYILALYKKLHEEPDLLLIDGHGKSHPRGMGIATQAGLSLRKPSIGVAKRLLFGGLLETADGSSLVVHPETREPLAVAYKEKPRFKPVFISVGAGVSNLSEAVSLVLPLFKGHREPEPLRYVHNVSLQEGRRMRDGVQQVN